MKLLALALVASTAAMAANLKITTHTAGDAGFVVNSNLISGEKEAILVDAQFTNSEAKKVVELVKKSGKRLSTIFVTHAHPDHYFGLEVLKKAFPKAKILAAAETIAEIKATSQGKLDYWTKAYGKEMPSKVVLPSEVQGDSLSVDGEKIQLVKLGPGESETATALYVPSLKTLLAGDLAFGNVHLWLAENRPDAWVASLKKSARTSKSRRCCRVTVTAARKSSWSRTRSTSPISWRRPRLR